MWHLQIWIMIFLTAMAQFTASPTNDMPNAIFHEKGVEDAASPYTYIDKYNALVESGADAYEANAALEEGLTYFPADKPLRETLIWNYILLGEYEKAKTSGKESLLYNSEYFSFAYMYLIFCNTDASPEEAREAAQYVSDLYGPDHLPTGVAMSIGNSVMPTLNAIQYCLDALHMSRQFYDGSDLTENYKECCRRVLEKKDYSVYGYRRGLFVIASLTFAYGEQKRFDDMEKWIQEYFALEQTAEGKDTEYQNARSSHQSFTVLMQTMHDAYLASGGDFDMDSFLMGYIESFDASKTSGLSTTEITECWHLRMLACCILAGL